MRRKPSSPATVPWKLIGGLSCLFVAISLCTPYPERLLRFVTGKEKRTIVKYVKVPEKKKSATKEQEPPVEEPPAVVAPIVVVEEPPSLELKAWTPEISFPMPTIVMPAFPPALPERVEAGQYDHINSMSRGVSIASSVVFEEGTTAAKDRKLDEAYQVEVSLNLKLPQAGRGEDLLHINPHLPKVLKGFDALMAGAKVSPWYQSLMLHKQNQVRKNAATLSRLLDRHNFYDTETILEIEAPETKRKLVWIQADMDVVSDGSDGDRLPQMPKAICESNFYQPTTSYRWAKLGDSPNPLLPHWEKRLKTLKEEKGSATAIDFAQRTIYDLKRYSFLLADYDPFVVLSLTMREGSSAYQAAAGDYVVVIVGKKAYPAIVGDYGPRYKSGEASLRLCKEINPRAASNARPISDLSVSYLVFPNSKEEKHGPIDYEQLYARCGELLDEIGGLGEGISLVHMEDQLAPPVKPEKQENR